MTLEETSMVSALRVQQELSDLSAEYDWVQGFGERIDALMRDLGLLDSEDDDDDDEDMESTREEMEEKFSDGQAARALQAGQTDSLDGWRQAHAD